MQDQQMVSLHLLRKWNSSVCFSMSGLGFKIFWHQVMYFLTNPFLLSGPFMRISEYLMLLASNAMCTENMSFCSSVIYSRRRLTFLTRGLPCITLFHPTFILTKIYRNTASFLHLNWGSGGV
jgi:hypothetical protein